MDFFFFWDPYNGFFFKEKFSLNLNKSHNNKLGYIELLTMTISKSIH